MAVKKIVKKTTTTKKVEEPKKKLRYVNQVHFTGKLGKDIEHNQVGDDKFITKSSLAVFQPGEEEPMWFDLCMWGLENETLDLFLELEKGEPVEVWGRQKIRKYEGKTYLTITLDRIERNEAE